MLLVVSSDCKVALKKRHLDEDSTGTDFRLNVMPTYLKMFFVSKVMVTLKRMTGKTQAVDTGLPLQSLNLLHMLYCISEMYLFLFIIVQIGCDQRGKLEDIWSTLEPFFLHL
jgi:hypothetical protein